MFGEDETVTAADFVARLETVDAKPAMGAKPADVTSDFDAAGAEDVFLVLSKGEREVPSTALLETLQELSGEEHGVPWKKFLAALTAA